MDEHTLLEFDHQHLWHPYTALNRNDYIAFVQSTNGTRLTLKNGQKLIDGMASWWCAIHGYNHPVLKQALKRQIDNMAHVMFGGLTHEPAIELGKTLLSLIPDPLQAIFYADSGSIAIEVALKMAVQYQQANGHQDRNRFLTVRGGYHGDTRGAMSVSDPLNGQHHLFTGMISPSFYAPRPVCRFHETWEPDEMQAITALVNTHQQQIAAIIIEPIVQGAGGMWFYHPQYLQQLRTLCDQHGLLLIFDEVATGFGRTGKLFAMEHAQAVPDILCLGKALTGGMINLAATITTEPVAQGIKRSPAGVLMHGPTFMASPLACAAAHASIQLLLESNWYNQVQHIEQLMTQALQPARQFNAVKDVRTLGAIGVIETHHLVNQSHLCAAFVKQGVWVRPFNHLIYIMPAYTISDDDLLYLCQTLVSEASKL